MLVLGILAAATLAWIFGYLYACQSIKTTIVRSYNVNMVQSPPTPRKLRVVK